MMPCRCFDAFADAHALLNYFRASAHVCQMPGVDSDIIYAKMPPFDIHAFVRESDARYATRRLLMPDDAQLLLS